MTFDEKFSKFQRDIRCLSLELPPAIYHDFCAIADKFLAALRAPAGTGMKPTAVVDDGDGEVGIDFDYADNRIVAVTLYPDGTWGWAACAFGQVSSGRGVPLPPWAVEAMRAPAVTGEAAQLKCPFCGKHSADGDWYQVCGPCRWSAAPPVAEAPPDLAVLVERAQAANTSWETDGRLFGPKYALRNELIDQVLAWSPAQARAETKGAV